mgnify:CR=1 FL=1
MSWEQDARARFEDRTAVTKGARSSAMARARLDKLRAGESGFWGTPILQSWRGRSSACDVSVAGLGLIRSASSDVKAVSHVLDNFRERVRVWPLDLVSRRMPLRSNRVPLFGS